MRERALFFILYIKMIYIFLRLFMSIFFYRLIKILILIHLWKEILSFFSSKRFSFVKLSFRCISFLIKRRKETISMF